MNDTTLSAVTTFIDDLATRHGIGPVKVIVNPRLRRVYGRARYAEGIIEFNPTTFADQDGAFETASHELAHIWAVRLYGFTAAGHGPLWKRCAVILGAFGHARKAAPPAIAIARRAAQVATVEAKRGVYRVTYTSQNETLILKAGISKAEARKVARATASRHYGIVRIIDERGEVTNTYGTTAR